MLVLSVGLFVFIVFLNRYFLGTVLRLLRPKQFRRLSASYEPYVTVVVPMYNEGRRVVETVSSIVNQDYPTDKLELVVVDDASTDDSVKWALHGAQSSHRRVTILRNRNNVGKRLGILNAVRRSNAEIVVSVDSDVVVEQSAVRFLVQDFADPRVGAVGGRVRVSNPSENWITRLQAIKFYFAYEYYKNIERSFHSVLCLSGCLSAFRRSVLLELEPVLENRNVFGVPIKYGEDRYLTRHVVKQGYQTMMRIEANCWTVVPNTFSKYWLQQLRWRRSIILDFLCGLSHSWKLHPLVVLNYTAIFAMLIGYPLLIAQALADGLFFPLAAFHLLVLAALGLLYWIGTRKWPRKERVHPLWFLPMAFVLPTVYLVITPLALFTLDSSSWETRGAQTARS